MVYGDLHVGGNFTTKFLKKSFKNSAISQRTVNLTVFKKNDLIKPLIAKSLGAGFRQPHKKFQNSNTTARRRIITLLGNHYLQFRND